MLTAAYVHPTRKSEGGDKNTIDFTNLYIKNLDKDVTSSDLFQSFKDYGKIISARVMRDTATGVSKGYGFVSYSRTEEAQDARQYMHGVRLVNKNIVITFHEPKKSGLKQKHPHQQQPFQHRQQYPYQPFQHKQQQPFVPPPTSRPPPPMMMDSPPNNVYPVYSSQPSSYSCHGFIPEHLSTKSILPNPWNDNNIWMQKNTHSLNGLQRTISSDSTTSPPSLFQRQKLRQAIVSQLDDEQMKDLDSLVDLIQSLRKRELSLCLFNPIYLRQKIIEAYRALYFSEKPTASTNTTPSLVHLEQSVYEEDAMDVLASLEGMSLNKKKRAFGDIFFPYVKATGVRRAPKITIKLLDTVPLDELAFVMYNKSELTRMAQHAAIEINC